MTSEEFSKFCKDMQKMIKDMRKQFKAVGKIINNWKWKFAEIQIQWDNAKTMWDKFMLLLSGLTNIKIKFRVHKVDGLPYGLRYRFILDSPEEKPRKRKRPKDPHSDPKAANSYQRKIKKPLDERLKTERAKFEAERAKFEAERERWRAERESYESRNTKPNQDDESAKTIGQLISNIDKNFSWIFTAFGALGKFADGYREMKKSIKGASDSIKRIKGTIKAIARVISGFVSKIAVLISAMGKTNAITPYR